LILDTGDFIAPDALIQKSQQPDGSVRLWPPRSDQVLYKLYKDAAAQIAGGLGEVNSKLELIIPSQRKQIQPRQTVNVAQAEVFGGGPYVNNAIHLPIPESAYAKWGERQPAGVPYSQLSDLMTSICVELGVNTLVTESQISDRSLRFAEGCKAIGEVCHPLPVSMRKDSRGCGSDNSVDSFGDHIGGIHPYSPNGANSFLTQAMHNPSPAKVSYRTRANKLKVHRSKEGGLCVGGVEVTRTEDNGRCNRMTITADHYVVSAGVGSTTGLVSQSLSAAGLRNSNLGKRLTANIGTAVYAMFAKPDDPVTLYLPTKSLLMRNGNPFKIRSMDDFEWALGEIRKRGPAFVNLLTTHPQGGASLGDVVDTTTFRLKTDSGECFENLTISDASLFPQGCEINPQLTVTALSTLASEQILKQVKEQKELNQNA
jgi:hypothetical protein